MKNKIKRLSKIIALLGILLAFPTTILAHSGKTDSSGGHKDKNNVSGLGSYHYHCCRYPAHLHDGGVCPYSGSAKTSTTTKSTTTNNSKKSTTNNSKSSTTKAESSTKTKNVEVEKVTLKASKSKIEINEELTIVATVTPISANNKSLTWKSSDNSIATVSSSGVVKAIKDGTVSITAISSNGKSYTLNITVNKPKIDVTELNLDESDITLETGNENRIMANVLPYNATDKTIKWTSSNNEVAIVENGKVKALNAGEVTITAETSSGIIKTCHVKVAEPAKSSKVESTSNGGTSAAFGGAIVGAGIVGAGVFGMKKLKFKK